RSTAQESAAQEHQSPASAEARHQANTLSTAFRKAAEMAVPTVVTIETRTKPQFARDPRGNKDKGDQDPFRGQNPFKGTPFEDFFGDNSEMFRRFGEGGRAFSMPRQGLGSGVIVDKSGIVLTNNHVVEGADEVTVRLSDGREFKATDIKTDPDTDLAVLHIEGAGTLPYAKLGDSDQLQIGDWVLAVGNPFQLESTVSAGIISSKGRELPSNQRARFLQTDAAINPGNSGGPLVNLDGEVVGINTAIATSSGGYQGIGFAIPSTQAKWVMHQLIKSGVVQRAFLGVKPKEVSGEIASHFGVARHGGVLVEQVVPNSPASRAGLKEGDVIVEFAGTKVHSPRDLMETVERVPVDSKQELKLVRDGKPVEMQVVVKPLPKELGEIGAVERRHNGSDDSSHYKSEDFGIEVTDLNESNAEKLGFENYKGVLITEVAPDSPAAEKGLRPGMLIMEVDRKPVTNVEQFEKALEGVNAQKGVLVWFRTEQGNRFEVLKKR
ncbi:MAG: Do family serine endopeptidase, partial [Pirellulales bacterium]